MAARKTPAKSAANTRATPASPAVLEWIMGGLGLLLVLACLGVILKEAVQAAGPPRLEHRLESVRGHPGAWLAVVTVRNTGGETAAAVEIEGRLGDETASTTVDYVPAGGEEKVVLGFQGDPRTGLTLITRGWSEP